MATFSDKGVARHTRQRLCDKGIRKGKGSRGRRLRFLYHRRCDIDSYLIEEVVDNFCIQGGFWPQCWLTMERLECSLV